MKTHSTAISQNSLTAITHAHLPKDTVLIFLAREKQTRKDGKKKEKMNVRHRHFISSTIASACMRQVSSDVRNVWLSFEGDT